jgi:hypothetical protein
MAAEAGGLGEVVNVLRQVQARELSRAPRPLEMRTSRSFLHGVLNSAEPDADSQRGCHWTFFFYGWLTGPDSIEFMPTARFILVAAYLGMGNVALGIVFNHRVDS